MIRTKTGKNLLLPSVQYMEFEKEVVKHVTHLFGNLEPISQPINLKAIFYRDRAYKSDLVNYMQALCDALVKSGLLSDDNVNIVHSVDGSRVFTDKDNPRIEVTITKVESNDSDRQGSTANRGNIIQMDFTTEDERLKSVS